MSFLGIGKKKKKNETKEDKATNGILDPEEQKILEQIDNAENVEPMGELKEEPVEQKKINLSVFGDIFPNIEINAITADDLILYVDKYVSVDGNRQQIKIDMPTDPEQIFPLDMERLQAMLGPGNFYLKLYNKRITDPKKRWLYYKMFTFPETEETEKKIKEITTEKTELPDPIKSLKLDTDDKFNQILEMIKTTQNKGELTFEQQLLMMLIKDKDKKGGSHDLNEPLLKAFASVKTAEITSTAETKKAEITASTELEKMRVGLEKAKLEINQGINKIPNDISENPDEAKKGLEAVVDGVNRFVDSINSFMGNLTTIIDKSQEAEKRKGGKSEIPGGDDIQKAVDEIVNETTT